MEMEYFIMLCCMSLVSARGGGGDSEGSSGGGISIDVELEELHNDYFRAWDPKIDLLTEILGVIGGIIAYLIIIWGITFAYGSYQNKMLAKMEGRVEEEDMWGIKGDSE